MILVLEISLVVLCLVRATVQNHLDPLKDFCRRFGHATTVIDRRLFIDGGLINWNPISANPLNYSNPYLLYDNLNVSNDGMPQLYANLSKNSTVPDVSGAVLWTDTTNKVFYQFGGEYQDSPPPVDAILSFDALLNQWNQTFIPDEYNRVSWGAGVSVNDRAEGYFLGGWMSNRTTPGWTGPPIATNSLIRYDMVQNKLTNNTGPDDAGRAEGVMVYLPASDDGLLIHFGGILDLNHNGTMSASPMSTIHVYDILSARWYTQTATGNVPPSRRRFCAGATWADDHSSYNIYLYGGLGVPPHDTAFDDVYILTLPSFRWIKWWPNAPGNGRPHHSMTCNVIDKSQMLIIGGTFPGDSDCDVPDQYGTHNLNLGANGPKKSMWDLFYPNITNYEVPSEIISVVGGGPSGGATVLTPQQNWDDRDLLTYFSRVAPSTSRTPTRAIPTATGHHMSGFVGGKRTGVILGAVLGGLLLLAIFLGCVLLFLRRKKNQRKKVAPTVPSELPTNTTHELNAESKYQPHGNSGHQSIQQTYFYSPGSGHLTPPLTSPGSQPAELHAGPVPEYGHPTPYRDGSFQSTSPGQSPPGVYPPGPYHIEQSQGPLLGGHPSPTYNAANQNPYHDNGQSHGQGGKHRTVPSPDDYSDVEAERHRLRSNTPGQYYSQQSEGGHLPIRTTETGGASIERKPATFHDIRRGQSRFFEEK